MNSKNKVVNPHNKIDIDNHIYNGIVVRGGNFNSIKTLHSHSRFIVIAIGTKYKCFRVVLYKKVLSIEQ